MFTVAGLVLLLAGSTWFDGAHTVGVVLLSAGVLLEVIPLVVVMALAFISVVSR